MSDYRSNLASKCQGVARTLTYNDDTPQAEAKPDGDTAMIENDEQALAACPFCGGEASFSTSRTTNKETIRLNSRDHGFGVNCINCGMGTRMLSIGYATKALAANEWNRRLAQPDQSEPVTRQQQEAAIVEVLFADGCYLTEGGYTNAARTIVNRLHALTHPDRTQAPGESEQLPVPSRECFARPEDTDYWYDSPDDCELVDGRELGETFVLAVSHYSVERTYRVTKVPDDTSDDYEVEPAAPTPPSVP